MQMRSDLGKLRQEDSATIAESPRQTHWISGFARDTESGRWTPLSDGTLLPFPRGRIEAIDRGLREALQTKHGDRDDDGDLVYHFEEPLDETETALRLRRITELAAAGRHAYFALFRGSLPRQPMLAAKSLVRAKPALISIARCQEDVTLPFAALYDERLDIDHVDELKLCAVFRRQLEAGTDLLEDPVACRAQADCPLEGSQAERTVCPFGFWGFRSQIEQSLQALPEPRPNVTPKETGTGRFGETTIIAREADHRTHVAAGVWPEFSGVEDHKTELTDVVGEADLTWTQSGDEIVSLIRGRDPQQIFYFFCHGLTNGANSDFRLKIGPADAPQTISANVFDADVVHWGEGDLPQPLVVLNGCETVAMRPGVINVYLTALDNAGASGVIGTEISISPQLARPVGAGLIRHLHEGATLGEAMLKVRHQLLREYNPLGLAFSLYASATLHLHEEGGCTHCGDGQDPGTDL